MINTDEQIQIVNDFAETIKRFMESCTSDSSTFVNFWKRKIKLETNSESILDESNIDLTTNCLIGMAKSWKLYRGTKMVHIKNNLRNTLQQITSLYDTVRSKTLMDLGTKKVSEDLEKPLNDLWEKLASIKDKENSEKSFLIMAPTKFLMFLWGQTPAFDEYLRTRYAKGLWNKSSGDELNKNPWTRNNRWTFKEWIGALNLIGDRIRKNNLLKTKLEELNDRYFESKSENRIIPYGFFIDAYLWQSVSERSECSEKS